MDLQTRKLNIISYIAQLRDEKFLQKIENYILNNTDIENMNDTIPFSVHEFFERIEQSERDFKNGNYKSQSELENLAKDW